MRAFTKLFQSIVTSSIWNEDDKTRILWVTLLALSDWNGKVDASVGGLAHAARISKEDCVRGLEVLMSPDDDSRNPDFQGKRIEKADGGFLILNYARYREAASEEERREYWAKKQRESRARRSSSSFSEQKKSNIQSSGQRHVTDMSLTASGYASASARGEEERRDGRGEREWGDKEGESVRGGEKGGQEREERQGEREEEGIDTVDKNVDISLDEVLQVAANIGCPSNVARTFFDKFESTGWVDKNGQPIVKWQNALAAYARTTAQNAAPPKDPHQEKIDRDYEEARAKWMKKKEKNTS